MGSVTSVPFHLEGKDHASSIVALTDQQNERYSINDSKTAIPISNTDTFISTWEAFNFHLPESLINYKVSWMEFHLKLELTKPLDLNHAVCSRGICCHRILKLPTYENTIYVFGINQNSSYSFQGRQATAEGDDLRK